MKRLTISIPDDVATSAKEAVSAGDFESVSAYFTATARKAADWAAARAAVDELIVEVGGIGDDDRAWARDILDTLRADRGDAVGGAA